MSNNYRIRTKVGVDQQVNIQLEQDFDQLEILSLKIRQQDVYPKSCADYGLIVGRVTSNGGLGIPNVRVSVFIPLEDLDVNDTLISSLYPYREITDINEDGYRYNLLPYEKQHGGHSPTGTFPSKSDILQNPALIYVYDKYYKFSVKTNQSGDYMIMGVPIGTYELVMDCDLSDIGEFSQSPQDLVNSGLVSQDQISNASFESSSELNSLPQIINQIRTIEVSPFWGQPDICQISITRQDFNLGDNGFRLIPSALFMGSLFSNGNEYTLNNNCRPNRNLGKLCNLQSAPGEIIAIRQTILIDDDGYPILEQAQLPLGGKVIDSDGVFLVDVPMNMDYVTTDEYGNRVLSNNPNVGIPTTAKYRFKIKYSESTNLNNQQVKRAHFLVPNIKEYGWSDSTTDPAFLVNENSTNFKKFQSSYYFGLDWSGYTNGFTGNEYDNRISEIINCEDTFFKMVYKKVYTTTTLIDNYKKGINPQSFLSIKQINDDQCEDINKFPATDANYRFDFLNFTVGLLLTVLTPVFFSLLISIHIIGILLQFVREFFIFVILPFLWLFYSLCRFASAIGFRVKCVKPPTANQIRRNWPSIPKIKLPMFVYPACEACDCGSDNNYEVETVDISCNSDLFVSDLWFTTPNLDGPYEDIDRERFQYVLAGWGFDNIEPRGEPYMQRTPFATNIPVSQTPNTSGQAWEYFTDALPPWEVINKFSLKGKFFNNNLQNIIDYFPGSSRIKVTFNPKLNRGKFHEDNIIAVLVDPLCFSSMTAGQLITFQNPSLSKDVNVINNITGTTDLIKTIQVSYADHNNILSPNKTVTYQIGKTLNTITQSATTYNFPSDIEYFQVITGMTLNTFISYSRPPVNPLNNQIRYNGSLIDQLLPYIIPSNQTNPNYTNYSKLFFYENRTFDDQVLPNYYPLLWGGDELCIVFLNRGVDPWSGKHEVEFDLHRLFGYTLPVSSNQIIKGEYYLNIPIQAGGRCVRHDLMVNNTDIQDDGFNTGPTQPNLRLYFGSYLFTPGTQYQNYYTDLHLYYSSLDADQINKFGAGFLLNRTDDVTEITSSNYCVINYNDNFNLQSLSSLQFTIIPNNYTKYEYIEGGSYIRYVTPQSSYGSNLDNKKPKAYFGPSYINGAWTTLTPPPSNPQMQMMVGGLVMRTDRLPTGTNLDTLGNNTFMLQTSSSLGYFFISDQGVAQTILGSLDGAEIDPNINDDIITGSTINKVINSLTCEGMVDLDCYQNYGPNLQILPSTNPCNTNTSLNLPVVDKGCYVLINEVGQTLFGPNNDFTILNEWRQRFRMNFALCRGVISESFKNSYVNGTLFAYPFNRTVLFNSQNKPVNRVVQNGVVKYGFCGTQIVFENTSNNFYYRSSPYNTNNGFVGSEYNIDNEINIKYLKNPTTMLDLGPQYIWSKDVIPSQEYFGYQMDRFNSSTYNSTESLTSIFTISRILNGNRFFSAGVVLGLFSRPGVSVDGDFAQMLQINSQYGVLPFTPENYQDLATASPIFFGLDINDNPVFGVFFSADTASRDLVSPRRIDYILTGQTPNLLNNYVDYLPVSSQKVPVYPWKITSYDATPKSTFIFGNEQNNWITDSSAFSAFTYQNLDRLFFPFFQGTNQQIQYLPGFLYQADNNGNPDPNLFSGFNNISKLNTGPWYFYFGIHNGSTAMDKFIQRYVPSE
jgi:hypothetical protein